MEKDDFIWVESYVTFGHSFDFIANSLKFFREKCKYPCYYLLVFDETSDYRWFRVLFYDVRQWRLFNRYTALIGLDFISGDMPCQIGTNNTTNNEIWQT